MLLLMTKWFFLIKKGQDGGYAKFLFSFVLMALVKDSLELGKQKMIRQEILEIYIFLCNVYIHKYMHIYIQ
jgi:hypothetical protein